MVAGFRAALVIFVRDRPVGEVHIGKSIKAD
jgi:hypothetical protein